ncbi:MAG TPA: hypothetical protein VFS67_06275 [Polyangiaceae bacterium]|nr:hypothetical protein [Polyangiaceae bacterium]
MSHREPTAAAIDPNAELNVYSQEPGYVVALAGRCLIQIISDRMTSTTISLTRRALADQAERYDTFSFLCVLEPSAKLTMAPDLRESVDAYVRRYSTRFTGAAIVFEATGFQATVVRSVVTAVNLASRASHPTKVFDDVRAACSWLGRLTPGEPTASRLFELAAQLRKSR